MSEFAAPPRRPGFTAGTETEVWRGSPAIRSTTYYWILSVATAWVLYLIWGQALAGLAAMGVFGVGPHSMARTLLPDGATPVWWLAIVPWAICLVPVAWRTLNLAVISYELTTQRLVVRAGILVRTQDQLELFRVRDFLIDTPLHMGLLGLSHVRVISRDETLPVLTMLAQSQSERLLNIIRDNVQRRKDEVGMREYETNAVM